LPPKTFKTHTNEIEDVVNRLRPYKSGHPLRRFGPEKDGGYLIPDDITEITACFSPGIGNTSGFELDCYKNGMKIFLADKSILPQASYAFEFNYLQKFLGKETAGDFISLTDWLTESKIDITKDLLLQMDIEAYEYETLKDLSQSTLNRFRIIVIELHFLDLLIYKPWFDKIAPIIKLLTTNHTVVHLHPNNCCGIFKTGSLEIPRTLEVTLLRNDRFNEKSPATLLPHPLDRENMNKPPLNLPENWYLDKKPSPNIKAIVLTYDRNHIITEHMIRCYEKVWPNNPFVFYIPYQNQTICKPEENKVYIQTPTSFKSTVLGLLKGIPDEEWVYWCIDDKYPIKLKDEIFEYVYEHLNAIPESIASLLLCRTKKLLLDEYVKDYQLPQLQLEVLERITLHQFWAHQFIRAKLLRRIFEGMPDVIEMPTNMVKHLHNIKLFDHEKLLVSYTNNIVFGESTAKRVLTENCYKSLQEFGLPLPDFYKGELSKEHFIGSFD
jgi:hypothetical protein